MLGIFKKKKSSPVELVDIGKLQEKGILKKQVENNDGTLDLSSQKTMQPSLQSTQLTTNEQTPDGSNALGFLGNITSVSNDQVSSTNNEDVREKLDGILRRFNKVIERIELLESKMDRIERRMY